MGDLRVCLIPRALQLLMNYLDDEIGEEVVKFSGNTKLGSIANSVEDRLKVQKTLSAR